MKICRHHSGVSSCGYDSGDIHLQKFRRICRTVVLFRQVWPELGWLGRRVEMIHESGAAYASQGDTCLGPGTP
jgi:hypothetical protein